MNVVHQMFTKLITNQSKKDMVSTSTATESYKSPRASTGGDVRFVM